MTTSDPRPPAAPARLPRRPPPPLLHGIAGPVLLRPWFDAVSLAAIVRWLFPLSRGWAAGGIAGDDAERFCTAAPLPASAARAARRPLAALLRRRRAYEAAAAVWESAVFAEADPGAARLVQAECRRLAAAQAWMSARNLFLPLHLSHGFPSIRWQVASEAEVEARHGRRLADPHAAFPAPDLVPVTESRRLPSEAGEVFWLRFPTRVAGAADTASARVIAPPGTRDPASFIFLHGIGVETEFWATDLARVDALAASGIRIIRPEGPWHGRRRPEGWFGGETVVGRGPLGFLDLFEAWVGEVARLIAWARATSRGPVAIGGISLGALASQLVATSAASWPAELRPDALLLVGTTGDVVGAALTGALGRALGAGERLTAQSWSPAALQRWAPLLAPQGAPAVAPKAILMVIGTSDTVTPGDGALTLARRWRVPADNLFLRAQGHFSVALGLERDAAPLARLAAILRRRS